MFQREQRPRYAIGWRRAGTACNPEIENFDQTVGRNLDVRRLQIAVDDALVMGRF
jgi:hypothetical protein